MAQQGLRRKGNSVDSSRRSVGLGLREDRPTLPRPSAQYEVSAMSCHNFSGCVTGFTYIRSSRSRNEILGSKKPGSGRMVASLDRKRLGTKVARKKMSWTRGVFDEEARRKPLAVAADAGFPMGFQSIF